MRLSQLNSCHGSFLRAAVLKVKWNFASKSYYISWLQTLSILVQFYQTVTDWQEQQNRVEITSVARFLQMVVCAIFPNYMCNFFMFEGLPETSEEGLTLELSVFESLYGGQFELSTKLKKRKSFCYTLHWSSTIVVLRNLPPFTLTFSSVNKRYLWVTVLSIRFGPCFGPLVPLRTNRLKTKFSLL